MPPIDELKGFNEKLIRGKIYRDKNIKTVGSTSKHDQIIGVSRVGPI